MTIMSRATRSKTGSLPPPRAATLVDAPSDDENDADAVAVRVSPAPAAAAPARGRKKKEAPAAAVAADGTAVTQAPARGGRKRAAKAAATTAAPDTESGDAKADGEPQKAPARGRKRKDTAEAVAATPRRGKQARTDAAAPSDSKVEASAGSTAGAGGATGILFVFAHGAGAGSAHAWMQDWAKRLARIGHVHLLDYPYILAHKPPPKAETCIPAHVAHVHAAIEAFKAANGGKAPKQVVLIGKSMGSRVGCHVAAENPKLAHAVVCLGYPLVSNGNMRDAVLLAMQTPALLVQGSKDSFAPPGSLDGVVTKANAAAGKKLFQTMIVEGGDHGLVVGAAERKRQGGVTQAQLDDRVLERIQSFLGAL